MRRPREIPLQHTIPVRPKAKKVNLVTANLKGFKFSDLFKRSWWKNLRITLYNAKNRFFYGYSDCDWFDWDYWFAVRNIELLQQLRDNGTTAFRKNPSSRQNQTVDSMTEQEQYDFFNMLIDCLKDMADDNRVAYRLYDKPLYECNFGERQMVEKERQKSIDIFFDIMKERYDEFWD